MGMLIAVAAGGAVGSLARYGLTLYCENLFGRDFPYGIFIANILGSLAIGVCFGDGGFGNGVTSIELPSISGAAKMAAPARPKGTAPHKR